MIHQELHAGVAYITLDELHTGNALNLTMLQQLTLSLQKVSQEPSCRVIVLLAEGPDFCKGLDLTWAFAESRDSSVLDRTTFQAYIDCLTLITQLPQPVVAAIAGQVTAGGLGLVAVCDIVLATNLVNFSLTEVIVGMIPALVTPFLLRRLSLAQVRYLTLSTRVITATEAQLIGLVDEVVSPPLTSALDKQLQRLLRSSPTALATSKAYFSQLGQQNLKQELNLAEETLTNWLSQPEIIADLKEFATGLAPSWFQKHRKRSHG